ncbi:hypothetical protein BgiMline_015840 [Biomphalaria glabrata]|nr:hypothetical protein BgiMline_008653 [Biomphalaria glabrata]KAI8791503.1 hypothetical protein BgiBS90_006967 [Biomphalaria glabrata]
MICNLRQAKTTAVIGEDKCPDLCEDLAIQSRVQQLRRARHRDLAGERGSDLYFITIAVDPLPQQNIQIIKRNAKIKIPGCCVSIICDISVSSRRSLAWTHRKWPPTDRKQLLAV